MVTTCCSRPVQSAQEAIHRKCARELGHILDSPFTVAPALESFHKYVLLIS
jgi:isopentenyldiphosphate isomerase